jgi:hypothetical protein
VADVHGHFNFSGTFVRQITAFGDSFLRNVYAKFNSDGLMISVSKVKETDEEMAEKTQNVSWY